jgi:hypothetical protein
MESKKINQLATEMAPATSDLTIIGDPITGVSKKITLLQIADLFTTLGTVTSVAVTETGNALTITGSPITSAGTINIGFAGDATQYVRGDGALADFPTSTGGGSSVSYYLNSSVSQGTIGGVAYNEFSKDPIAGAGTDITASTNGYIASYLTDANDPALLEVPAGNFNCEFYFSVNSNAHNPYVYAEVYKYDGTTFTLIGSSQSVPEYLRNGTTLSPYYFAIPVSQTTLAITDRIAIRIYVNVDTRVVTLHTENNHLCQVVTTFSKGLTSLNNLTRQIQFFGIGTSGTDFNISSSTATHTFNLPVASATNTGKLSSTDWSTFNNKLSTATAASTYVPYTGATGAVNLGAYDLTVNSIRVGRGAGSNNSTNSAFGFEALKSNTTGIHNAAFGYGALSANTTANDNAAFGMNSLLKIVSGDSNTALGPHALENTISGSGNIAIGWSNLFNATHSFNTSIGTSSGGDLTSGQNNIFLGYDTGRGITTGSNNTIIGGLLTLSSTLSNNIILADGVGNIRYQWNGTNNVFGNPISGTSASFSSSVTGNTIVKSGGTSSQFLKADGSIDSTTYQAALTNPITGTGTRTINYLPLFSGSTNSIANSSVYEVFTPEENIGVYVANTLKVQNALVVTGNINAVATTLTGALSGTTASFSGEISTTSGLISISGNATGGPPTGGVGIRHTANRLLIYGGTTDFTIQKNANTGPNLTILESGVSTFVNSVIATQFITGSGTPSNTAGFTNNFYAEGSFPSITLSNTGGNTGKYTLGVTGGLFGIWNNGTSAYELEIDPVSSGQIKINRSALFTQAFEAGRTGGAVTRGDLTVDTTSTAAKVIIGRISSTGSDNTELVGTNRAGVQGWSINGFGLATFTSLGTGLVYSNGGTLTSTNPSDERLKDNIADISWGLDEIMKLRPVEYTWKNDTINQGKQYGFIAQEVELVIPELVKEFTIQPNKELQTEEQIRLGLEKDGIYVSLVKAIQEQQAQIEELKALILAK